MISLETFMGIGVYNPLDKDNPNPTLAIGNTYRVFSKRTVNNGECFTEVYEEDDKSLSNKLCDVVIKDFDVSEVLMGSK